MRKNSSNPIPACDLMTPSEQAQIARAFAEPERMRKTKTLFSGEKSCEASGANAKPNHCFEAKFSTEHGERTAVLGENSCEASGAMLDEIAIEREARREIGRAITIQEAADLARQRMKKIDRIYLHWTAGRWFQAFEDYHFNIEGDGRIVQTCVSLDDMKAHTWRRNSGSIGIALCCALDASWPDVAAKPDLGRFPPTRFQLEACAQLVRALCKELCLAPTSMHVLTHAEIATVDGYGPGSGDPETRWDLAWVRDGEGKWHAGGEYIRMLASCIC